MQATLEAIKYKNGSLEILNQLLLPWESVYETITDTIQGHEAIKSMKVRGAPAIAIVGALSLAVEIYAFVDETQDWNAQQAVEYLADRLEFLKTSRPTAVNLADAAKKLLKAVEIKKKSIENDPDSAQVILSYYIELAEQMLVDDIKDNKAIGSFGADFIQKQSKDKIRILTHCNTGSLATAGWGTALGIVRELHARGVLDHCFCTETRPYNQGSRLTAYELVYEQIPSTLITDSMASALMQRNDIAAVVVGADRVAANGDTANKIGTYQLAIAAQYHGIPFLVAAPSTSIDLNTPSGDAIEIEERSTDEVTQIRGQQIDDGANLKEPVEPVISPDLVAGSRSGSPPYRTDNTTPSSTSIPGGSRSFREVEDEDDDEPLAEPETMIARIGQTMSHFVEELEERVLGHSPTTTTPTSPMDGVIRVNTDISTISDVSEEVTTTTVRIAAPGIGVWNPAFDVTPAKLITGIVTERGMAVKKANVFDMKSFLK